eukprot:gene7392-9083_t
MICPGDQERFHIEEEKEKTIILMGISNSGKTTLKETIKKTEYIPKLKSLFSDTIDSSIECLSVHDRNTGKRYTLKIIDTPGLFETRKTINETRDNETILDITKNCMKRDINSIHALCVVISSKAGFLRDNIESVRKIMKFFGPDFSMNSMLVFTHTESMSDLNRKSLLQEFNSKEDFKDIAKFFQLGVFFTGALDPERKEDYEESPSMKARHIKNKIKDEAFDDFEKKLSDRIRQMNRCSIM